jgi:hypothetical protein
MRPATIRRLLLPLAGLLTVMAVGGIACDRNSSSATATGGQGGAMGAATGASGGASGIDGAAGSASGGANACAASTGGGAGPASEAGGAGGGAVPQQVHDALLNAPTFGGIEVTRAAPTSTYPACP